MYLRWGEGKGFKAQLVEVSGGDVAGIKKDCAIFGDFAFGWLRTETGVHRLVENRPLTQAIAVIHLCLCFVSLKSAIHLC